MCNSINSPGLCQFLYNSLESRSTISKYNSQIQKTCALISPTYFLLWKEARCMNQSNAQLNKKRTSKTAAHSDKSFLQRALLIRFTNISHADRRATPRTTPRSIDGALQRGDNPKHRLKWFNFSSSYFFLLNYYCQKTLLAYLCASNKRAGLLFTQKVNM